MRVAVGQFTDMTLIRLPSCPLVDKGFDSRQVTVGVMGVHQVERIHGNLADSLPKLSPYGFRDIGTAKLAKQLDAVEAGHDLLFEPCRFDE